MIPVSFLHAQTRRFDESWLNAQLKAHPQPFREILRHARTYEVQILYTRIDRDQQNTPRFTTFSYREDPKAYFYPASTVKFPVLLLAFEKMKRLGIPGLNRSTAMYHDSVYSGQRSVREDTTAEGGVPSLGHYAKKIMVVSDNDAYNRLYEFVGQRTINEELERKGYRARILHRLERGLTPAQNRHTEAVRFMNHDTVVYRQPMLVNDSIASGKKILRGRGYYKQGSLIRKPMDFTYSNFLSLRDGHLMLKSFLFPDSVSADERFDIAEEDRRFILKCMSQLPRETFRPAYYQDSILHDGWVKYFMPEHDTARMPASVRIFNKVGLAYGYVIDHAYVVDFDRGVEFLLSAVIHTNRDGIFNDDRYEYTETAFPFLRNLGKVIYEYEVTRPREVKPDLSEFRLPYGLDIDRDGDMRR